MVIIKSVLLVLLDYFPFSRLRQVSSLNSNPFLNNSYRVGVRGETRCTEALAFAGSEKGSHYLVYCTQPYPVFTQEAVSRT